MNILDIITNAGEGAALRQLGSQVGLGEEQTASALAALAPALAAGFNRNLQAPGGLASLASALSAGNHQRYLDNPAALAGQAAVIDGNGILGHVLGSKEVSREIASRAAAQSGVGADVIKQMLPLVAAPLLSPPASRAPWGASPRC